MNKDPTSPQICRYTTLWNVMFANRCIPSGNWKVQLQEFVDPGVKINGWYYLEVLLSQQLLPAIRQVSGDLFVFQQDSAPAHRARETIKLLQRETPAFISPDLWPPNSPDLNPVNYKIWGVMLDRVYQIKSEGRERVERATGWGLGRTATERDWRCHRPVAQTPACMRPG